MIKAVFYKKSGVFRGFHISGHAGFDVYGKDIVCAAVSSAAMLTVNLVTDHLNSDAEVTAKDNTVSLMLNETGGAPSDVIAALSEHIGMISEDHKGTIRVSVTEV